MNFKLVPTWGSHQKILAATLVKETRTEYHVQSETGGRNIRFRKVDGMPVLRYDRQFPCYKLVVQTTAEEIAEHYGNNGHLFHDDSGIALGCYCQNRAMRWHINPFATDTIRFVFSDGSAIVIAGDAWDIEGKELFSFASNRKEMK